ncbi:MAG: phosphoenolpyruvate--protein phosphotransferase [Vicinamibacteria bacterium]|nr:phosphoenolpyruvate--protein phosphotransferase [Vicinamibacteria bacterium]
MKLSGFAIAPGQVLGKAFVFRRAERQVPFRSLDQRAVSAERERLQTAFRGAQSELADLRARLSHEAGEAHAYLFDAQILMLQDPLFAGRSLTLIEERLIGAEWALSIVCDELRRLFARASSVIAERSHDLDDVLDRVLALLGGTKGDLVLPRGQKVVLVCEDLKPSEAAEIDWSLVGALVADHGSPTHHMAILARSRSIPCVLGVRTATTQVPSEALVLVDGDQGFIETNPPPQTRVEPVRESTRTGPPEGPARTGDGDEIILRANIEFPSDIEAVRESGAMGVGLFRSEYLLSRQGRAPSEDAQLEIYRTLALAVAPHPLTVRTFDLGPEDLAPASPSSPNPALGLRAFRLLSRAGDYFRTQLRALLRAADEVAIRILFPFVGGVGEAVEILSLIEELEGELQRAGRAFRRPPLGAMIEIPSAALVAESLGRTFDYLCVGTNDLIQYTLAVDRADPRVGHLYAPFHPGVVRLLGGMVSAAREATVPLSVCGEMAASREGALLLVGLGYRELSMAPSSLRQIRHVLAASRTDHLERAVALASKSDSLTAESFAATLLSVQEGR